MAITHKPSCPGPNVWYRYTHGSGDTVHNWEKKAPVPQPEGQPAKQPCPTDGHGGALSTCTQAYCKACGASENYVLASKTMGS